VRVAIALALHDAGFRDVDVYESALRVTAACDPEILNNRPSLGVGQPSVHGR
jgi:hypothetical protein